MKRPSLYKDAHAYYSDNSMQILFDEKARRRLACELYHSAISGVQSADFVIKPVLVAPGVGEITVLVRTHESDFSEVYLLEIVPDEKIPWRKGVYVFAVGVRKGFDKGQTLASVLMD